MTGFGGEPPANDRANWPGNLISGETGHSLAAALEAASKHYRERYRLDDGTGPLILPAWANPTHLSDEQFRRTPGAAHARAMGFSVVMFGTTGSDPVREIEL